MKILHTIVEKLDAILAGQSAIKANQAEIQKKLEALAERAPMGSEFQAGVDAILAYKGPGKGAERK